jgi:hypothetical protein
MARPGLVRPVWARRGLARQARPGNAVRGRAWSGTARQARQGEARRGAAGLGLARLGRAGLADIFPGPGTGHAPSGVSKHEKARWQLVLLREVLIGPSGAGI